MSTTIGVIGTGYVGLVTGTCFAESGNHVICVDIDESKVEKLRSGEVPIYEPGLEVLFERNIRENRIRFTTDVHDAIDTAQILFLCLPTPPDEDGSADLQYVLSAAKSIALRLHQTENAEFKVIVNKSTVPVGTARKVQAVFAEHAPNANVEVVSNPEFLREGFAVEDFMKPDRVVIGTGSERAAAIMQDLYEPFTRSGNPIYTIDIFSAEIAKYAANSFLAMRISFMNDIAQYCETVGANVDEVRIAIGADTRIGKRFLFPGIGYGGSCFPKDVKALIHSADKVGVDLSILKSVEHVNHRQPARFVNRIVNRFGGVKNLTFGVWGIAFKPNTDDTREAPAFKVIDLLLEQGASVRAYDPEAADGAKRYFGEKITIAESMIAAVEGVDALIIATEWNEFRRPDFELLKKVMKSPIIFDGRNVFDADKVSSHGFEYFSIGRPDASGVAN